MGPALTRLACKGRSVIDFHVDEESVLAASALEVSWRTR